MTRFINGSHLLRVRNLPGLHAALRLAASSLTVASDDVFRRDVVPEASHPTVTSRARPGRQLPVVRQVTARQTARDKTETDFAIQYIADLRPADGDTCRTGWLYLAVIIDLFSRQVVGWSMQPHMKAGLVTDALRMAWFRRRPDAGVIVHGDRGSQYCSGLFQDTLKAYGMRSSMSRRGDCWDTRRPKVCGVR
jgi:transposase InsO family protein